MVRAKAGIAVTIQEIAAKYPELVQLLPETVLPPLNWWLVCHRDVRVNPRIHSLMTFLCQWFQQKKWVQCYQGEEKEAQAAVVHV